MKPEVLKLIERKKLLTLELKQIDRDLSALTYGTTEITFEMLNLLPFNELLTGKELRELSRSWRRFLTLPLHSQNFELERCNISVEKAGTNGRRFIRREF